MAIELAPMRAGLWSNLGNLLAKTSERATEAEATYQKAIELDPRDARIWNNLGNLFARTPERAAEAEAAYRKAIELDPNRASFWNNLGNLLVSSLERIADAEAALSQGDRIGPYRSRLLGQPRGLPGVPGWQAQGRGSGIAATQCGSGRTRPRTFGTWASCCTAN